jgi:hypothetical protein
LQVANAEVKEKQEPEQETVEPKVFIGIPTGPTKLYSTYYMVAALANLHYENMEIHWAVTGGYDDGSFHEFRQRLTKLMDAVKWPLKTEWMIHYVPMTKDQRSVRYAPILKNKRVMRDAFLDGDCEYFLLLGGDNPPPRESIKKLLKVDADISMAVCYQRPGVDLKAGVYPLVWHYAWMPSELERFEAELHPLVLEQLRLAWLHCPMLMSLVVEPGWRRRKILWNVTGGDGCALIKREVLEMIDWGVTPDNAYHSEDIHFMTLALWHGFTTAALTGLHCPHMSEDGRNV